MTTALSHSHFLSRAAHECERRVFGDTSEKVEPASVLVVEDEYDMRLCFTHLFRLPALRSCQVEMAESVGQAMAMIATRCYDLAVLDYRLDGGTAADLVRMWREHSYELPFLCVSGYYDVEKEMRALGASGFINKSELTGDALAREIRRALDSYWTARARR